MIAFDTNVLVYATASFVDDKVTRARDLVGRAMQSGAAVLLLQTFAEHVGIRKARIAPEKIRTTMEAWLADANDGFRGQSLAGSIAARDPFHRYIESYTYCVMAAAPSGCWC